MENGFVNEMEKKETKRGKLKKWLMKNNEFVTFAVCAIAASAFFDAIIVATSVNNKKV